jgi:hypothetical protein
MTTCASVENNLLFASTSGTHVYMGYLVPWGGSSSRIAVGHINILWLSLLMVLFLGEGSAMICKVGTHVTVVPANGPT